MVIGIDMDDTICSTNELIIEVADKYDKEVLGGTGVKDVEAYEFTDMLGWNPEMKGQFFKDKLDAHSTTGHTDRCVGISGFSTDKTRNPMIIR